MVYLLTVQSTLYLIQRMRIGAVTMADRLPNPV